MKKSFVIGSLAMMMSVQSFGLQGQVLRSPSALNQVESCEVTFKLREFIGGQLKEEETRLARISQALDKVGKEIKKNSKDKETNEKITGLLAALGAAQIIVDADLSAVMSTSGMVGHGLLESWQMKRDIKEQQSIFKSILSSYKLSADQYKENQLAYKALSTTCNSENFSATAEMASKIINTRVEQYNQAIKLLEDQIQNVPPEQIGNYLKRPTLIASSGVAALGGLFFFAGVSVFRAGGKLMGYCAMGLGALIGVPSAYSAYKEVLEVNKLAEEWKTQLASLKSDLEAKRASLEKVKTYLGRLSNK